jgi:hypothetical protein
MIAAIWIAERIISDLDPTQQVDGAHPPNFLICLQIQPFCALMSLKMSSPSKGSRHA